MVLDDTAELIIGYLAATLVSLLQLPQVYKTYQLKNTSGLSIGMIVLNFLASILWLIYGIILNKAPIYISNVIYFIANCALLVMKYIYDEYDEKIDQTALKNIDKAKKPAASGV